MMLCLLGVDAGDYDCRGNEPLFQAGRLVGQTTSGGYGHFIGKSLAIGWIETGLIVPGAQFDVEIYGEMTGAKVLGAAPFDPDDARSRG